MSNVEEDLTKLKFEISQWWRVLFRHKWRRPTWIRFPRSVIEDIRWIRLSDRAKAAWPIMLIMASEDQNARLPNAEIVYRRLREVGLSPRKDSFSSLIDEYIQGGFILKTSPEYRVQGTDYRKKESIYSPTREAPQGFALSAQCASEDSNQQDKRLSEEGRGENPQPLAQPNPNAFETAELVPPAAPESKPLTYQEAQALGLGPPRARFEKIRHNGWKLG